MTEEIQKLADLAADAIMSSYAPIQALTPVKELTDREKEAAAQGKFIFELPE